MVFGLSCYVKIKNSLPNAPLQCNTNSLFRVNFYPHADILGVQILSA
ncbi:hypothetical protein T4D_15317 [Trichinella pseudospiralis]|uniref:Uncharacterized protein n=1 Tax=Trichinella pseudospiralis TaxID=6337 RepID=A0A0V1DJ82_TRIPS|nr:hypothetical protein T4D_15317 [Trichinella pseudospiralis]